MAPRTNLFATDGGAGELFGSRWEVVDPIVESGQSRIYKVDEKSGREPISVLKERKNPKRYSRFAREIEVLKALFHENIVENIVRIVEDNIDGERPFRVSGYCEIGSLEDCWTPARGVAEALDLLAQVCDGLAQPHHAKVVHREIKPANIFLRSLIASIQCLTTRVFYDFRLREWHAKVSSPLSFA